MDKTEHAQRIITKKRRFIISVVLCCIGFYLCLPLSIAFFPQVIHIPVYHHFHLGWIMAFAQFAMTWAICSFYLYKAKRFDQEFAELFFEDHTQ